MFGRTKVRMHLIWLYFCLFLWFYNSFTFAVDSEKLHKNRKRLEIARPTDYDKDGDSNNYVTGKTYRRQEVIHPLNEDTNSKTSDDDIEKYGKTIDSTGAVVKSNVASKKEGSMKDVIAKIKEIQDKIFKRTGSKELEKRLKEMTPQDIPEPSLPIKSVTVSGDRRKIIPEDVVDKILQKFQQLRSEAKHVAFAEDSSPTESHKKPSDVEKSTHSEKSFESESSERQASPYASIGPPKESMELKNRTEQSDDVAALQADGTPEPVVNRPANPETNHNIQIPIGNSFTDSSQIKSNEKSSGIPLMFVKHGENLIPVYSEQNSAAQPSMSVTEKGSVQYNANPGVAPPSQINNAATFAAGNAAANMDVQTPPIIENSELSNLQSSGVSRCSIPGPDCQQQEIPNVDNNHNTLEVLNQILHSPIFPQLASRLMEQMPQTNPSFDAPGYSRGFNQNSGPAVVPMSSTGDNNDVQSMSPASVQFGLKQNIVTSYPGEPSMLRNPENIGQSDHNEEVQHFLDSLPENNPSAPAQPNMEYTPGGNRNLNDRFLREHSINDISDPLDTNMSPFKEKSPDELLEYAKYRSLVSPDSTGPSPNVFPPITGNMAKFGKDDNVDPSNLLDTLHNYQLKNNLAGPGDPSNYQDLHRYHESMRDEEESEEPGYEKHNVPEPAPDDLLDQLRHWNQQARNAPVAGASRHHIPLKFGSSDPSFADEIRTPGGGIQVFDVERKDVASEHSSNKGLLRNSQPFRRHGDISVMSDDMLQYKHGRLSMDSDDILSSFENEQSYSRNKIGRPRHKHHQINSKLITRTLNPSTRWNIERPHASTDSDVELRVNGALITDNTSLRSTIVDGKYHPGKGKTFASKGPVQIELSHGNDKRKIINILTKGKYNITQDYKRTKIPKTMVNLS